MEKPTEENLLFCLGDINGDFVALPYAMRFTMTTIYEVVTLADLLMLYASLMKEHVELVESLKQPCTS